MEIRKIDTGNSKDTKKFIQFPFQLYNSNPFWVPPMINDMKFALNRNTHPFYKHSEADFFIVEEGSKVLGRVAAIDNNRYKKYSGNNSGFIYFFESINDTKVAKVLFETVFNWSRKRRLGQIIGPKGLIQGDGLGLLVEGFQYKPAMGIPYNHEYYPELFENSGFIKEVDYLSGYLTSDYEVSDQVHQSLL